MNPYYPVYPPQQQVGITDYATLCFSIASAITGRLNVPRTMTKDLPVFDIVQEKFDKPTIKSLSNTNCYYFFLNIPGNPVNALYIIDTNTISSECCYYRQSGGLIQVSIMDLSVLREESVTMDVLGAFFATLRTNVSAILAEDNRLSVFEAGNFSYFVTFATVYFVYGFTKEDFIEMQQYAPKLVSPIEADNKVYENLVAVINSRKNSEIMIQRCMKDGMNGIVPDNLLRTKVVSSVQKDGN